MLREQGLIFVGIDVIGDYLTEINVTSPTGLQEIARFDGINLAGRIWDRIEARIRDGRERGVGGDVKERKARALPWTRWGRRPQTPFYYSRLSTRSTMKLEMPDATNRRRKSASSYSVSTHERNGTRPSATAA